MIHVERSAPTALLFDVQATMTGFHSIVCSEARRISDGRHPDMIGRDSSTVGVLRIRFPGWGKAGP